MRYIEIPQSVTVVIPVNENTRKEQEITFLGWLASMLDDKHWGTTSKLLLMSADLEVIFERATEADVLELTDAHFEELSKVVAKPAGGYIPALARPAAKFIRAFETALTEHPKANGKEVHASAP